MADDDADAEYATKAYAAECPDLSFLARRPCWQRQASCRGTGTDLWFPTAGISKAARRPLSKASSKLGRCSIAA